MKIVLVLRIVWMGAFVLPLSAAAADVVFEQGSLIIPMQKAYQPQCGAVAAYGLVYRYLQKGVTIYWAISPTKTSQYRCKNVTSDSRYLDGCDFAVSKASGLPVQRIVNTTGLPQATFTTSTPGPNRTVPASPPSWSTTR